MPAPPDAVHAQYLARAASWSATPSLRPASARSRYAYATTRTLYTQAGPRRVSVAPRTAHRAGGMGAADTACGADCKTLPPISQFLESGGQRARSSRNSLAPRNTAPTEDKRAKATRRWPLILGGPPGHDEKRWWPLAPAPFGPFGWGTAGGGARH